jgi:hypothetical protein
VSAHLHGPARALRALCGLSQGEGHFGTCTSAIEEIYWWSLTQSLGLTPVSKHMVAGRLSVAPPHSIQNPFVSKSDSFLTDFHSERGVLSRRSRRSITRQQSSGCLRGIAPELPGLSFMGVDWDLSDVTYHRNYCSECNWNASSENLSRHEVTSRAIEHFNETRHAIESERIAEWDRIF